jgi:hypothetical protein
MNNFLLAYRKAALKPAQHQQLLLHTILRALSAFSQFHVFAFLSRYPFGTKVSCFLHVISELVRFANM